MNENYQQSPNEIYVSQPSVYLTEKPHPNATLGKGEDGRYYWMVPTPYGTQLILAETKISVTPISQSENVQMPISQGWSAAPNPQYIQMPPVMPRIPRGFTEKTYNEFKEIKKQALSLGWPLLCLSIIGTVFYYIMQIINMAVFGSPTAIQEMLGSAIYGEVVQILLSSFMFTIPFIVFAKFLGKQKLSDICGYEKIKKGTFLPMILFGIGFCAFSQIASSVATSIFDRSDYNMPEPEMVPGITGIILSVLSTVVAPSLVEEFACRGIVLGSLRRFGDGFAIVVSSILFGVMHGNIYQIPFAFCLGLALGYIRVKSNSIWICVIIHAFNNGVSVLVDIVDPYFSNLQINVGYTVFLIISLILGIFSLLLYKNKENLFKLKEDNLESSHKQRYKWFFTSPIIIIFLVENIVSALIYFLPESFL